MKFKRKLAVFLCTILAIQTIIPAQLAAASPAGPYRLQTETGQEDDDGLEWGDTVDLLAAWDTDGQEEKFHEWQERLEGEKRASASTASDSTASRSVASKIKKVRAYEPVYQPEKETIASPADAFKKLTIETKTEGGEPVSVKEGKVSLAFRLTLDDEYLGEQMQKFYSAVDAGTAFEGFDEDCMINPEKRDAWIDALNDEAIIRQYFPDISFQCTIGTIEGTSFKTPDNPAGGWLELISASQEKLGEYRVIRDGQSENLLLECRLIRHIYNRVGVSAYQSFQLELADKNNDGRYPQITAGAGDVNVKIKYISDLLDPDNRKGSYNFEKAEDLDSAAGFPVFSYQLHASLADNASPDADLRKKYVSDPLPAGLEVIEAVAEVTYENGTVLESRVSRDADSGKLNLATASEAWKSTTEDKMVFLVPSSQDAEEKAKEVTIHLTAQLTADAYKKYLSGDFNTIGENRAYLAETAATNDSDAIKMDQAGGGGLPLFFHKDGEAEGDLRGEKWKWEIAIHPYFTSAKGIYLIDHIPDTSVHSYDDTDQLFQIQWETGENGNNSETMSLHDIDDISALAKAARPNENTPWYTYSSLIADRKKGSQAARELMEAAVAEKMTTEEEGIYFKYNEDGREQAVYIAPLSPKYWRTPVNITYCTKTTAERNEGDAPDSLKKELENNAAIVWEEAKYGPGPGTEMDVNTVTMGKKTVANYSVLEKKAVDYDEKTQLVTWEFDVNRYGADLGKFTITDTFEEGIQDPVISSEGIELEVIDRKTGETNQSGYISEKSSTGSAQDYYYEINGEQKTGGNSEKLTLTVTFENITSAQCYRIRLKTRLKDPSILRKQDKKSAGKAQNTAYYTFDSGDTVKGPYKIEGVPIDIPNTWIEKGKEPFTSEGKTYGYDYVNHLMRWKVIVNSNHLPVSSAVLTDTLPTVPADAKTPATDFYLWEGVRRDTGAAGTENGVMGTAATPSEAFFLGESGDKVKITLDTTSEENRAVFKFTDLDGNPVIIHDCYEFTFTTRLKDDYRKSGLITDIEKSVSLKNNAEFTGYYQNMKPDSQNISQYEDQAHEVRASAWAENSPGVRPAVKKGQYHPYGEDSQYQYGDDIVNVSWIEWEIALNRDQADMTGITMTDVMEDWYELDTDSLKIYTAAVEPDGSYKDRTELSKEEFGEHLSYSNSALNFTIPEKYGKSTLIFCFNTILTDSVSAGNMKNTVTLYGADGNAISREEVSADGAKDFNFDDFITASTAPFVRIKKGSSNSVTTGIGKDENFKYPLPGAEFELSPMEYNEDAKVWSEPGDRAKSKHKVTNHQGICNFIPLKRDVLYQLKEVAAPEGYKVEHTNYYFLLDGTNKKQVGDRLEAPDSGITIVESGASGSDKVTLKYEDYTKDGIWYHSTDTSEHYLVKMISNGPSPDNQVTVSFFKKTDEGEPVVGAEFKLIDSAGKLNDRTLRSDEQGYAELKDVDAGTYDLVETGTPEGFIPIRKGDVKVSVAGTIEEPEIKITGKYVREENQIVTIVNQPSRSGLKLHKQTPDRLPLSGAEFVLSLDVDGNEPVAFLRQETGAETGADYVLTTEKSEAYINTGLPGELVAKKEMKYFENRTLHMNYVDSEGLLDGTYYLREYLEPLHFERDTNTYQIKLEAGKVTDITAAKQPDNLPLMVSRDSGSPDNRLIAVNTASTTIEGHKYAFYYDAAGMPQKKPLAGIRFNLYDENGNLVREGGKDTSDEGISQNDGKGTFAFYGVAYGTYYVKEGPGQEIAGYETDNTVWQVKVKDKNPVKKGIRQNAAGQFDSSSLMTDIEYNNTHKNGTIRINKVAANGEKERNGVLKHVDFDVFTRDGLKICRLVLDETESCYTLPEPDSITDLAVNDVGEPYLTRQAGTGIPALIAGSYYVVETNPEPGYYRDVDEEGNLIHHEFTVTGGDIKVITNRGVTEDLNSVFTNTKAELSIMIQKWVETETDSEVEKEKQEAGAGFLFRITYQDTESGGLFEEERISQFATIKEGAVTATPSDAEVSGNWIDVETGQTGRIIFGDLLPGTYRVTELEKSGLTEPYRLPEGESYILDINDRNEISLNGTAGNEIDVINWWKRYNINGKRYDSETSEGLKGAEIGLFPAGTTEFTKENLYKGKTAISGEDGSFRFEDIPCGDFVIAEVKAPAGYEKNSSISYVVEARGENKEIGQGYDGSRYTEIVIGSQKKQDEENGGNDKPDDNKPDDNKPDDNKPDDNKPDDSKPDDNKPDDNKPDDRPDGNKPDNNTPDNNDSNNGDSNNSGVHGNSGGPHSGDSQKGPGTVPESKAADNPENRPDAGKGAAGKYPEIPEDLPKVPSEQTPDGTTIIKVPVESETEVEILNSSVESVYRGRTDMEGRVEVRLPADDYVLVVLDEGEVPLACYRFSVGGDTGKLPKTGESRGVPFALIATVLLGFAALELFISEKKRAKCRKN